MLITVNEFSLIANRRVNDNMVSALRGLQFAGDQVGLAKPHRLAMFLAQTAHESGRWIYDREIWGPTATQRRYEGRKDLGNIQPGDGSKFRGYTPMQITGRYNTTRFHNWCKATFPGTFVPDFIENPELMNTDPWEGIGPLWYWGYGANVSLNVSADAGDFVANTKLINGGVNGIVDRYNCYARAALVLLGKLPYDLVGYQRSKGLSADNIMGIRTFNALHKDLFKLPEVKFN